MWGQRKDRLHQRGSQTPSPRPLVLRRVRTDSGPGEPSPSGGASRRQGPGGRQLPAASSTPREQRRPPVSASELPPSGLDSAVLSTLRLFCRKADTLALQWLLLGPGLSLFRVCSCCCLAAAGTVLVKSLVPTVWSQRAQRNNRRGHRLRAWRAGHSARPSPPTPESRGRSPPAPSTPAHAAGQCRAVLAAPTAQRELNGRTAQT